MADKADSGASRRDILKVGALGLGTVGGATLFPGIAAAADPPIPVDASYDYFLKLDGIPGDSTVQQYAKQIEVLGWAWGITNSSVPAAGGAAGTGKAKRIDFTFAAFSSIASPPIFLAVATGKHLNFAILSVVRRGDSPFEAFRIRFDNVILTSYEQSSGDTDGRPIDVVKLDYGKVTYTARTQAPTGGIGETVTTSFNFITNTAG
jgi:type VI secretion system secreted protein Hcp